MVTSETPAAPGTEAGFGLVEALVAVVVFAIGVLSVAAVAVHAAQLSTKSAVATDQTLAASQVFALLRQQDFDAVTSGEETVQVGDHSYTVERDVVPLSSDTKQVVAVVSGVVTFPADTFETVLHRSTGYPSAP
jgi:Tfp pilus assembly protein PilV